MIDNRNDFIILGGDGNEYFEQTIRSGIKNSFEQSNLRHLINIDLAPFVPSSKKGYNLSISVVEQLLDSFRDNNKGCVILPGTIMPVADESTIDQIFNSLRSKMIKTVSIGMKHSTVPSLFADDYQGITDMMEHLHKFHGYKNIAYVSGPDCYDDAAQRNRAYKTYCDENSITKVIAEGDFSIEGGKKAVDIFQAKSMLGNIDAVVCADDGTALGVIERLKEKGYKVPLDIAVTGFDNSEYAKSLGIASVDPLLIKQGEESFNMVFYGEASKNVHTDIVKNWSCGCSAIDIKKSDSVIDGEDNFKHVNHSIEPEKKRGIFPFGKKNSHKATIENNHICSMVDEILESVQKIITNSALSNEISDVLNQFLVEKSISIDDLFKIIYRQLENVKDLDSWNSIFKSVLDDILHEIIQICSHDLLVRTINLYQNYDSIISCVKKTRSAKGEILNDNLKEILTDTRSEIVSSGSIGDLIKAVESAVKELEIKNLSMILNEGDENYSFSTNVTNKMVTYTNYREGISNKVTREAKEATSLLKDIYSSLSDRSITIAPLYHEAPFGYLVFGDADPAVVQSVQESISLALENIRKRELDNVNKARIAENRDKIIHLVEPLIDTAKQLSYFVATEKEVLIDNLKISSNDSIETINKANKAVEDVNSHLKLIVKLIKTIDDITEKTEVLSINASIEAARAGEYGRGFKVISSGIKKLSEAQRTEAERVDSHIREVEAAMENSLAAGSENQDAIDRVKEQINKAITFFDRIEDELERIITTGNSIIDEIREQNRI